MMYLLSSTSLFSVSDLKEAGREICAVIGLREAMGGIILTDTLIFLQSAVVVGGVSAGNSAIM